jgi:integrase
MSAGYVGAIRRETARAKRKARPLVATDLQAILAGFGEGGRSARDRLLFALGFAGALRRSELVGLDWQIRGSGTGLIVQDDRGLVITLLSSKTGKGEPEEIIIPCSDMPTACNAIADWISRAGIQPGTPLLRSVNKGGEISAGRLCDRSVSRIIKKEVRACAIAAGRSEAEAEELAELCSGHSLRAGYCTASAVAGIPEWKARRRSRHRSAETFAGYVRAAEEWADSGLKGVGFYGRLLLFTTLAKPPRLTWLEKPLYFFKLQGTRQEAPVDLFIKWTCAWPTADPLKLTPSTHSVSLTAGVVSFVGN